MSESNEPDPREKSGTESLPDETRPTGGEVEGQGGEGSGAAAATPPIGEDGKPGQTQVPAADDDVGVRSKEEGRDEQQ